MLYYLTATSKNEVFSDFTPLNLTTKLRDNIDVLLLSQPTLKSFVSFHTSVSNWSTKWLLSSILKSVKADMQVT